MDLFALLRAGVRSGDTPDIGGSTDDRWRELYTAASSQGVSALVWDGIRRLPPGVAAVEGASVALGLQRRADRTPVRAAASPGSGTGCGLRRSGNSYRRIERARRQPVVPCSGTSALRRSGLFPLRRLRARQSGGRTGRGEVKRDFYKHSHIVFRGLTVEKPPFCTAVAGAVRAKRFERHLQRLLAEGPLSCIPETALLVPPPDFNALFLAKHALSHFLTEGISLRHLCDWAVFIDREGDAVDWTAFRKVAAEDRLLRFAEILSDLSVRYLGVARNPLPAGHAGARRPGIGQYPLRAPAPERFAGGAWTKRMRLIGNLARDRWKYGEVYGRSFLLEGLRLSVGYLFDRNPEL